MSSYTLVWQPTAIAGLLRIRSTDPHTAKTVRAAVSALAHEPHPVESTPLGTGGLHRMRLGDARVLYEVDDTHHAVHILTIGHVRR